MITYWDYEQRSPDWYAVRAGRITASSVSNVLSSGTGRERYMRELAAEAITDTPAESYTNSAMQWGIDTEPHARAYYEIETGNDVVETGFCTNDNQAGCGVSPDGLIGDSGLLEIKCPATTTHIEYLLSGKLPARYKPQVQMQLMVTERDWCDFVSYDPRVKYPYKQMLCVRVARDDEYIIGKLAPAIVQFRNDLAIMLSKLGDRDE